MYKKTFEATCAQLALHVDLSERKVGRTSPGCESRMMKPAKQVHVFYAQPLTSWSEHSWAQLCRWCQVAFLVLSFPWTDIVLHLGAQPPFPPSPYFTMCPLTIHWLIVVEGESREFPRGTVEGERRNKTNTEQTMSSSGLLQFGWMSSSWWCCCWFVCWSLAVFVVRGPCNVCVVCWCT